MKRIALIAIAITVIGGGSIALAEAVQTARGHGPTLLQACADAKDTARSYGAVRYGQCECEKPGPGEGFWKCSLDYYRK